jgi:hypothetical protein
MTSNKRNPGVLAKGIKSLTGGKGKIQTRRQRLGDRGAKSKVKANRQ